MTSAEDFHGTSFSSFEDAVLQALPPPPSNVPETFVVVQFRVERGGVVLRPQYKATVRRA